MISEFQTTTGYILANVKKQIQHKLASQIFPTLNIYGQELWVQQLLVEGNPSISKEVGEAISIYILSNYWGEDFTTDNVFSQNITITQNLHLTLSSRSGINFTTFIDQVVPILIKFSCHLESSGKGIELRFEVINNYVPSLSGQTPETTLYYFLNTCLSQITPGSIVIPFEVFQLPGTEWKKYPELHVNFGMALSQDLSFITIRIESSTFLFYASPWQHFFNGESVNYMTMPGLEGVLPNSLPTPLCLFVDKEKFCSDVSDMLYRAIEDAYIFDVTPGVGVDWSINGQKPRLTASFTGQISREILGEWRAAYVPTTITIDISVLPLNNIKIEVHIDVSIDIAGIDVMPIIKLFAGSLLDSLSGKSIKLPDSLRNSNSTFGNISSITVVDDSSFVLISNISTLSGALEGLLLDSLGTPDGMIFIARGADLIVLPYPSLELQNNGPSIWVVQPPNCSGIQGFLDTIRNNPSLDSMVSGVGSCGVKNTMSGTERLIINQVSALDDPDNLYTTNLGGTFNDYLISIRFPYLNIAYYSCHIAVYTNIGIFLIAIEPPIASLSASEIKNLAEASLNFAVSNCEKLRVPPGEELILAPGWLIDPVVDHDPNIYEQLWEIEVSVIKNEKKVSLTIDEISQVEINNILPNQSRNLSAITKNRQALNLRFKNVVGGNRISLSHKTEGFSAHFPKGIDGKIGLTQKLLYQFGHINAGPHLRFIKLISIGKSTFLLTAFERRIVMYDITALDERVVYTQTFDEDLRGISEGARGSILLWGDFGLVILNQERKAWASRKVISTPILSGANFHDMLILDKGDSVGIYGLSFVLEKEIQKPFQSCAKMLNISKMVLMFSDDKVKQLNSNLSWSSIDNREKLISEIHPVQVGNITYLFSSNSLKGGSLLTLSQNKLIEIARYNDDPWFYKSARSSNIMVSANREGHVLLYSIVKTLTQ